jgi:RNA polymerase sigma-70 factor, ECF subfamily
MDGLEAAIAPPLLTFFPPLRLTVRMEGSEAALPGDAEEVFRRLVEEHSRMVFRLAFRLTGNEQDAEDVVQEAFLKAYRSFGSFDSRASFSTWIHSIASHCAIDLLRRKSRRAGWGGGSGALEAEDLPSHRPGPEAMARGAEVGAAVTEALDGLSPNERTAFVLRHFENAAKQAVFRAVHKLRRRLAPLLEAQS